MTVRDPATFEFCLRPPPKNGDQGLTAHLYGGGSTITVERYMAAVQALQCDAFQALADEVPRTVKSDRVKKAIQRTARWLTESVEERRRRCLKSTSLFASILGGIELRQVYSPSRRGGG